MLTEGWTKSEAEAILAGDNRTAMVRTLIAVSMDPPDLDWAQEICIRFARHEDDTLRGNAILGFGHIARVLGALDRKRVSPIVTAALSDPSPFVRSHAESACDDLAHFLGWPTRQAS